MNNVPVTTEELLASLNRQLPFSDEAEKGVLSCLLQHPLRCEEAPLPEMFYHEANRTVALAIVALYGSNKPVDPISLTHFLRDRSLLDKVGGAAAISELYGFCPIPFHFPYYSAIVREKFSFRQMIGALASSIAHLQAFTGVEGDSATDALNHCQKLVCEAVNDDGSAEMEYQTIRELIQQVFDDAEKMQSSGQHMPGLSTGIPAMDAIFGGLEEGCLTVVSAESSDGKSTLCRQMLEAVAAEGHCAMDFTYEMMPKTEARRILCSQSKIESNKLKMGTLSRGEQEALKTKTARVMEWDIHIIDAAGKTIEQICRHIARRSKKMPKGKKIVALIDYIQLCKTSAVSKSREREIAHITYTAKQCAKMTGAHILMPSQQNKDGDVRESMAIEQDADTLIQIQKITEKPKEEKKRWEQPAKETTPNNIRRIFFKKLRDGERYTSVKMELVGRFFRFEPVHDESQTVGMMPS